MRRPFSVYRTQGEFVEIIFNVVGKGSSVLRKKQRGDLIDALGPLGVPFSLSEDDFDTAVLVGGGLGVAPLPIATATLVARQKSVLTFIGSRTDRQLVKNHLINVHVATDDGTEGLHGTVVDLLKKYSDSYRSGRPKIFACGPTKMLHAVAAFAIENTIPCEVSLEGPMACGFGICQGCPVELTGTERKYALMCKDGPTFDVRRIRI
ncbi:MAG: dihydroorotate dehydrogenase electron transfer subunit [Bacteroidetes bacterium]|nr:dihydroorotate dehydrogenase electron transfer subunit [Bacteroidota bacterium]